MPRLSVPTQIVFAISLTLAITALIVLFVIATPLGIQNDLLDSDNHVSRAWLRAERGLTNSFASGQKRT